MTSKNPEKDRGSNSTKMIRPNCTIKKRHDELLDELEEARYASRSEALRAAIESHAQSVSNSGETGVEQLIKRVEELGRKIDEIDERIDELQDVPPLKNDQRRSELSVLEQDTDYVGAVDTSSIIQSNTDLENEVYTQLSERGAMSVLDIAEHVDGNEIDVRGALGRLDQRGFITCTRHGGTVQYQVREPTNSQSHNDTNG